MNENPVTAPRVRLGDYVRIRTGRLDANASSEDGQYPFFTCSEQPLRIATYSYDCECVLVAGNGDLNVKYYDGQFDAYQRTYIIESADKHLLDVRYLYHFMSVYVEQLRAMSIGGVIKYIKLPYLTDAQLALPVLEEQRRIAGVLDNADALRAQRRAAIAQLDDLTQAIFLDMFGDPSLNSNNWPMQPLASLVRPDDTINYGVVQPGDDVEDGVPLVRVGNLRAGGIDYDQLKRIASSIESSYKRSRLHGDEVLVSCVGSIGVVALADERARGFNIARAVARIPLAYATNRVFLAAYLNTPFVKRYFTNELRTVSQPTLNIKQLSETLVVLPPKQLQDEFSSRVGQLDELRGRLLRSSAEMDLLFSSLQHRGFRGEL